MISKALDGKGSGDVPDLIRGRCGTVLVERANPKIRLAIRVACFNCASVNELDAAAVN